VIDVRVLEIEIEVRHSKRGKIDMETGGSDFKTCKKYSETDKVISIKLYTCTLS